jgi:hypothetical protein
MREEFERGMCPAHFLTRSSATKRLIAHFGIPFSQHAWRAMSCFAEKLRVCECEAGCRAIVSSPARFS